MRLTDFIAREMEALLTQWEAFAATLLPAARHLTPLQLRDHARQILEAVAKDLTNPQTEQAQAEKSMGRAPRILDAPETAAEAHATLRARSGFDINQLVAEYRALRASVLRLWADACAPNAPDPEDIIRFNEAIDQAVAESVRSYSAEAELARNLLLGMITHDMRNPLQTIQLTARYLASINAGEQVSNAASRVIRSGTRIQALLDDLVDFDRTKLGLAIPIVRLSGDLAPLLKDEVEQLRVLHPDHVLELEVVGDTRGKWDGPRLQRVLGNLIVNAIKYGDPDAPVRVVVAGEENEVHFEVRNAGPAIEQSTLDHIFDPLRRGQEHGNEPSSDGSLGLGLYIAREIATAHGGEITVRSDNEETVFSVRLPRREGLL